MLIHWRIVYIYMCAYYMQKFRLVNYHDLPRFMYIYIYTNNYIPLSIANIAMENHDFLVRKPS